MRRKKKQKNEERDSEGSTQEKDLKERENFDTKSITSPEIHETLI